MRLKNLSLQGYKTFAGKTEFHFEDGITAIVGPNGSGKSNVADALRWVLGEQSYSTLRGKRTIDMIFAGSQSRPRAGMAQVILTLDNVDGWLPIEFSEIEIGRRAFRSGENEYLLNGQKVRLKDITELLATSGLAERTYTIIGQGLIDRALSLRAEERRALFEEAAGVNQYKNKRSETLRRLEETQHNLERVNDILAEIRPRLTSLRRQANRARNYEQIAADLRYHLRIWHGYQWERIRRNLRRARKDAAEAQLAWEAERKNQLSLRAQFDELRQLVNQTQRQIREKQSRRDSLREQLEDARRQAAVLKERQTLLIRQASDIKAELPDLERQQELARMELELATTDLERAQAAFAEQQEAWQAFETRFKIQQQEIDRWQQIRRDLEHNRRSQRQGAAQLEGRLSQLHERLEEKRESQPKDSRPVQAKGELEAKANLVEQAQRAANDIVERRALLDERRREAVQELARMRQATEEEERNRSLINQQVARLETRCQILEQNRRSDLQIPDGLPLTGRLSSLITISDPYAPAIETAIASRLDALIVPEKAHIWQLIKANQEVSLVALATASLDPPPALDRPEHPGAVEWADTLVEASENLSGVVKLLLNRVLVCQDRDSAYELALRMPAGVVCVTLEGLLVHARGLVQTKGLSDTSSLLSHEAELRETATALEETATKLTEIERRLANRKETVDQKQAEVNRLNEQDQALAREGQTAVQDLSQAQREMDRVRQQLDQLERRRREAEAEVEQLTIRIADMEHELGERRSALAKTEAAFDDAGTQLQALPVSEAQEGRRNLKQQIESAQTILAGRQAVVDSRRATLGQINDLLSRRRSRLEELADLAAKQDLEKVQTALGALEGEMTALDGLLQPQRDRLSELQVQLENLEEVIAASQRTGHELENRYTEARIALSQYENESKSLVERIQTDLGLVSLAYDDDQPGQSPLPIAEVVEELPTVTELPADIEETINHYRGQLTRIGAVNPSAPEEFEETKDRFEFLTQQVEDLNSAQVHLRRVIDELDEITSRSFAQTVEQVDVYFRETFKRLFGGGSAHLVLTDPDDLTISGVDIVARLPSRREQGLALLSGGERSLTAAALIFALLKVSPTPFCVLDEVDAMLDEANVNRFREMLMELRANTQFIIITHNRGTVQVARTVYGISMGADSASQVISIRPEEYIRNAD